MPQNRLRLLSVCLFLGNALGACLPLVDGEGTPLDNQEVRLTLLHTSDIHSRLVPYEFSPLKTDVDLGLIPEAGPFGGASRLAALIKRERARSTRVLHFDSGDVFQGAPIFNVSAGEAEFRFFSKLRLDAAVVGNHEFDAGPINFANQARDNAVFPLLAANYLWESPREPGNNQTALYTSPYTIRVVDGVRVGVIGMANISSLNSIVEGGNSFQLTPLEQNEAARSYVELLRPVTDLIVIVSHLGLTEDQDLVQGYQGFYEYGRIKSYLERPTDPWQVKQWFGPEGADSSVVEVHIPGVSGIDVVLGGHLHVVLNPPQQLTDPSGRKVVLSHSGAFAKYVGRLDLVLKMPAGPGTANGAEVQSHEYRVFPIDSLWCDEAMHSFYKSKFWNPGEFSRSPGVPEAIARCTEQEDKETTQLLQPYILGMDFSLALTSIFSYAPRDIARRNTSNGGDSPLGNLAADSMRTRRRVEAEVALTNSLGIRDNLYAGPITQESMFNVFPFENTINLMYLSGSEIQELFDFVTEKSAGRGCLSQAQISGARFTMDCAQVQLNDLRVPCDPHQTGDSLASECRAIDPSRDPVKAPWQCLDDVATGGRCWSHSGIEIKINGKAVDLNATYRVAVNDYIAKGGSGFKVLKRNTTRLETGISLRDSLVGYMQGFCSCDDILAGKLDGDGLLVGKNGRRCGNFLEGRWQVDSQVNNFCALAQTFRQELEAQVGDCSCKQILAGDAAACGLTEITPALLQECVNRVPPGPAVGHCSCRDALGGDLAACGHVTPQLRSFCEHPTSVGVAMGIEDGRISRRVK